MSKKVNGANNNAYTSYVTYTTTTPMESTVMSFPCGVCGGSGIVYGKDGKPYLCPKCQGEKVVHSSPHLTYMNWAFTALVNT